MAAVDVFLLVCAITLYASIKGVASNLPCDKVSFNGTSTVCRCNITYCDTIPPVGDIPANHFTIYTTSQDGKRLTNQTFEFSGRTFPGNGQARVNRSVSYQTIIGFGGAITDAASMNIFSLSSKVRQKLLESYYSPNGIEYTLGRVPVASCDFSTHEYSYDDIAGDLQLRHFSLVTEDLSFKIPVIKSAKTMSKRLLRLFSSPWSAPGWMKTDSSMHGRGFLKGKPGGPYFKAWANYLVKFLDEYKKQGVEFWGLTAQNEPLDGRLPGFDFQSMGFTAEMQRDFISSDLGPALRAGGYGDLKLMIFDDSTLELPSWAKTIYSNANASQYVSGLGFHWYMNGIFGYKRLTETHNINPNKFILGTEACAGSGLFQHNVKLGDWDRGAQYANDILQDLQNWSAGWTDWNIALNMSGGPNWVNNNVDSPIIVDAVHNVFYKQPMYYMMGHFSKFLTPGSVRHELSISGSTATGVMFTTPEGYSIIILKSTQDGFDMVDIIDGKAIFSIALYPQSMNTLVYKL